MRDVIFSALLLTRFMLFIHSSSVVSFHWDLTSQPEPLITEPPHPETPCCWISTSKADVAVVVGCQPPARCTGRSLNPCPRSWPLCAGAHSATGRVLSVHNEKHLSAERPLLLSLSTTPVGICPPPATFPKLEYSHLSLERVLSLCAF